jgi:hypothetical protein
VTDHSISEIKSSEDEAKSRKREREREKRILSRKTQIKNLARIFRKTGSFFPLSITFAFHINLSKTTRGVRINENNLKVNQAMPLQLEEPFIVFLRGPLFLIS